MSRFQLMENAGWIFGKWKVFRIFGINTFHFPLSRKFLLFSERKTLLFFFEKIEKIYDCTKTFGYPEYMQLVYKK